MGVEREPGPRHEIVACRECGRGMCKTCPENYHLCSRCGVELCDSCFLEHSCGNSVFFRWDAKAFLLVSAR